MVRGSGRDLSDATDLDATPGAEGGAESHSASGPRLTTSLVGRELADGRFRVDSELGAGGMGVVYEAYDRARDQRVALKHLMRVEQQGSHALKVEFRALSDVEHPNVIRLHELFCDGEPWFFTMDLVRGRDFIRALRGGVDPVSVARTLQAGDETSDARSTPAAQPLRADLLQQALVQLIHGVQAIHAAGKLHLDLKPSNILVAADGRVVILDFGLVTDSSADAWAHDVWVAGTPGYIAPERFTGSRPSEACDWYSVGALLHETLHGSLPSSSPHARPGAPPQLTGPREAFDTLEALCAGLTEPSATARWDGERALALLGAPRSSVRSSRAIRNAAGGTHFVGRREELRRLDAALAHVRTHRVATFLRVTGESGIGKTALLMRFLADARASRNAVVLHSRCYERESVRYKTLDGIMDQLSAYWSRLSPAEGAALLPRGIDSLAQVFGVFSQVPAVGAAHATASAAVLDLNERRGAAFRALKELLARMCDRYTMVIAIDDLQWGDDESAEELSRLLSPPDAPAVLIVSAYRSSDLQRSGSVDRLLQRLQAASVANVELALGALQQGEMFELVSALSERPIEDGMVQQIGDEAQGSPFFVGELVRQHNRRLPHLRGRDLVQARIASLSAPEHLLLELISLAPAPIQQRTLQDVAKLESNFEPSLRSLLAECLIRERRGEAFDLLEPYHDRIRETVLRDLAQEDRRAHHRAFARAIRSDGDGGLELVAVHLEGAGELESAADYYEQAADQARSALAFDHAASMYEACIALRERLGGPTEPSLRVRLAEVLAYAGHGPRSAESYVAAAAAATAEQRSELRLRAAEQLLYAGHHEPAMVLLRELLPKFGIRLPRGPRWFVLIGILVNAVRLQFRRVRDVVETSPQLARRAQICDTLADATLYVDIGLFTSLQQQHVFAGLQAGDAARIALALISRALMTASPFPHLFARVLPDLERAAELGRDCPDPYVRGRLALNRGVVYAAASRYEETNTLARRAEQIFRQECHGERWGLQHAIAWQSVSLFYLGRYKELDELCRENLEEASRRGDKMLSKLLGIWAAWVALARGITEEVLRLSPALPEDELFSVLDSGVLTQRGPMLLYLGRDEEAWELYRRCEPLVRRIWIMSARPRACEFFWTRGLAASHLFARRARRDAERVLRRDIRSLLGNRTDEARAMAEHLQGNLLLASGEKARAADKWLDASRHFSACGMAAFAATLRVAAGILLGPRDSPEADPRQALEACGVGNVDRWVSMWCLVPALEQAVNATLDAPS
jgi:eukaryotic-like serine/threonine-protein kinase